MRYIAGIDEAGRGPLAGPVSVGAVCAPEGFDFLKAFPGLNDSKQLSEKKREEIFALLLDFEKERTVRYHVSFSSHSVIDGQGISHAVSMALSQSLTSVLPDASLGKVFLDGSLKAPKEYEQETVIHGDSLIPAIMLASVAAKVLRDRMMVGLAGEYPAYGFEKHKGYGTRAHIGAIKEHGPSAIHRMSFLSNIVGASMPA